MVRSASDSLFVFKYKPSRYKLDDGGTRIKCNEIPEDMSYGVVLGNRTETVSNWSVAEEIKRLITINTVVPFEKEYNFHRPDCAAEGQTPFTHRTGFYNRGKSTGNATKYQCKVCKKITNVLPKQNENFSYNQKRNDILLRFAKAITSRTPVKRVCEQLEIGSQTYYEKLEWLYKKCLEFLDRHETQALKKLDFDQLWLNTDFLIYNLNNIRQRGKGKRLGDEGLDRKLQTSLISSGDLKTGYIFRADIAYDFTRTLDEVESDTIQYHCDHTYSFLRKNERLKYPYCPQPPTKKDEQTEAEYYFELQEFELRKQYVEGSHTKTIYTALAHYWLIRRMLNVKEWFFVSDDDSNLQNAIFRVFSKNFLDGYANYFVCQTDKSLDLEEAGKVFYKGRIALRKWGKANGYSEEESYESLGLKKLKEDLIGHDFYKMVSQRDREYPIRGHNPIMHTLPDKDEGHRRVDCITDLRHLRTDDLADLIFQVNSRTINNFFQVIRRRVSILERPLVTARGEGKSYIYANYNPKYAQYITTILRTFYNFCWVTKVNGQLQTPAQRLGITDKQFTIKDIIYFC